MILSLLVAISAGEGPTEPLLLEKAKLVMHVNGWQEAQITVGNYDWWNPKQILVFLSEQTLVLKDVDKGSQEAFSFPDLQRDHSLFSPDRKLVLRETWDGNTIRRRLSSVGTADDLKDWRVTNHGPKPMRDTDTGYSSPTYQWSPDGTKFYEIQTWGNPPKGSVEVVEHSSKNDWIGKSYPLLHTNKMEIYADACEGKGYLFTYRPRRDGNFPISSWDLERPGTLESWSVKKPKGLLIVEFYPSPDYSRAVWLMGKPAHTPTDDDNGYPYTKISLWSSDLHGRHMHEIGVLPFHTKNTLKLQDDYQHFGGEEWNPDAKHFSFIWNRDLYLVDAK